MSEGAEIRDLTPHDIPEIRRIHEDSQLDYQFPDLLNPLFLVKKVLDVDSRARVCVAGKIQLEAYLFLDHQDNWADPEQKLVAIKEVERAAVDEARAKGVDEVVLWLPPEMERFGRRLVEDLGFSADRNGWKSFSKKI